MKLKRDFIKNTDMVRIIPVQAPRNYTADLTLRKGSKRDASLPVVIKKTDIESDYPYLTKELALKLNRNSNFMAATIAALGLKGDPTYHQPVRASQTSHIQRYSQAAYDRIAAHLRDNPEFDPYQERRRAKWDKEKTRAPPKTKTLLRSEASQGRRSSFVPTRSGRDYGGQERRAARQRRASTNRAARAAVVA